MEIKNAKITSTMLGFEDHGFLTWFLHLDFGNSGVGFGGYALGGDNTDKVIRAILETVGVETWEDLKGKYVRVKGGEWGKKVEAVGNVLEEKWFTPFEDLAAQ
jgi:hypothetical protein